jgi:hypothetical protein
MLASTGPDNLAGATGGRALAGNDPSKGLRRVTREAKAYYLIGFQPERGETGAQEVRVHVRRDDLEVRTRTRYLAGTTTDTWMARDRERHRSAIRSIAATSEVPLRLATLFFQGNDSGRVTAMYAAEIRLPPGTEGHRRVKAVAEALPRDGGGGLRDEFEEILRVVPGVPTVLSRQWQMPPGVWQLRILVEDEESGRIGTAVHTFEVPSPGGFRFSTPVLTNVLEEAGGPPRPRVVLTRTFQEGETLYCQVQVYGAAPDPEEGRPQVTAHYELRKGDVLVRRSKPSRIRADRGQRLSRLMGLSLEGATTGNYELVLRARDEIAGRTTTVTERFSVRPARGPDK